MSAEITTTVTINASREQVWAVLTDFASYGDWSNFRSITGEAVQGTKVAIRMPGMAFSPTLTVVDPDTELRWAAKILSERMFLGQHSFRLSTNPDGTTLLTNHEVFSGFTVVPFKRLVEKQHEDTGYATFNRSLKAYVEDRTSH